MENNVRILVTALLPNEWVNLFTGSNIEVDVFPFINVEPLKGRVLQKAITELSKQKTAVVFTSGNAVRAVADMLSGPLPEWEIYCIGAATNELVNSLLPGSNIVATAPGAALLATKILEHAPKEITFFCGDKRLPILMEALAKQEIMVNEITVYQTVDTPKVVEGEYQGILFFSPSAIKSFFSCNKVPPSTVFFTIGGTTARELRKHSDNELVSSNVPLKEMVVRTAIKYFTDKQP